MTIFSSEIPTRDSYLKHTELRTQMSQPRLYVAASHFTQNIQGIHAFCNSAQPSDNEKASL